MPEKTDLKAPDVNSDKKQKEKEALKKKILREIRTPDFQKLVLKGSEQGYLNLDEINDASAHKMFSPGQMEQLFFMLEDLNIEVVEKKKKAAAKKKAGKASGSSSMDFGSVTDPVKMYLREMGLVTLLSREDEVSQTGFGFYPLEKS